jgi:DNA replication protein DnaC
MGYKTAFAEVMSLFRADRQQAEREADERRLAVYNSVPRIREIDTRLTAIGVSLAVHALAGDTAALGLARAEMDALNEEKKALFKANNIPDGFTDIAYKCTICNDSGLVEGEDGYSERCTCLKRRLIEKYYDLSNLKPVLREENFNNFVLDYYSTEVNRNEGISPQQNMQTVYRTAARFVEQFGRTYQNLLLYGNTGLGKTFLCNCIAKDLLDAGHIVLYITAPRLFKLIEDARFKRDGDSDESDDMIESATEVDLLIIDDLGAEFSTVITSSALFDIFNQRRLARKATVISTNLTMPELNEQYSDRIVSRILGDFNSLKFFGDDIRVKKKYRRTVI